MAARLAAAGAFGLVLFNRFVQPDILLEELEVTPQLVLSTSDELRLSLRWIAVLHGRRQGLLALTSGTMTPEGLLKAVCWPAPTCVMVVLDPYRTTGRPCRHTGRAASNKWMNEKRVCLGRAAEGLLSQQYCPDPAAFERGNYMKALTSYTGESR